ncbi:MAG: type II secretion system GspH family protein [Lachnospiraceae bacterium]|nr:type II secretion system GspH family protein [Lachnospiraceae bacterium]
MRDGMKKKISFCEGNEGFSLVELIVVFAIIAALVGVLAPSVLGQMEKARRVAVWDTANNIYTSAQYAIVNAGTEQDTSGYAAAFATSDTVTFTEADVSSTGNDLQGYIGKAISGSVPTDGCTFTIVFHKSSKISSFQLIYKGYKVTGINTNFTITKVP